MVSIENIVNQMTTSICRSLPRLNLGHSGAVWKTGETGHTLENRGPKCTEIVFVCLRPPPQEEKKSHV